MAKKATAPATTDKPAGRSGKGMHLYVPPAIHQRMHELAKANKRTFSDEVIHAFERHLEQPPVISCVVPPLKPAEVVVPPPEPPKAKKPRGRPRKYPADTAPSP